MSQYRHFHVWGNDGRSLCDQHARPNAAPVKEGELVFSCGPCVIAAEVIHSRMRMIINDAGEPDIEPSEAVSQLAGTRWLQFVDIAELQAEILESGYTYYSRPAGNAEEETK